MTGAWTTKVGVMFLKMLNCLLDVQRIKDLHRYCETL